MWTYHQASGLFEKGEKAWVGYAGKGRGKNVPAMQEVPNVGPLPRGGYKMGKLNSGHPHLGPNVIELFPDEGNLMFGRSGFFIHGDSIKEPGTASNGCIVLPREARLEVGASDDRDVRVVEL